MGLKQAQRPETHKLSHWSSAENLFFWRGSAHTHCRSEAEWHAHQIAVHSLALTQTIKASAMKDCQWNAASATEPRAEHQL